MHCYPCLPTAQRPPSDARMLQLERELTHLAPAARFRLGGQLRPQLWDAMMRGLQSTEALPVNYKTGFLPHLLRLQQLEEEHDDDDDGESETALVPAKRSKTNSERGRAFRARRKKYEDDLVTIVSSLRQEVTDLGFLRSVHADKVLTSRNSMGGSLVRLASEYFTLFERGMPSARAVGQKRPALLTDGGDDFESKQRAFLECAMDPDMQFSGANGPKELLNQWKRYTSYHSSLHVEVVGVEVSGEEDNPMVTVRSDLRVVFSHATFDHIFPHVADNEQLVSKFVGREVIYHGVNRFQFSSKGQIVVYDSDVGFVDALVQAGASVSDIALLMQQARISDECRLGDENDMTNRVEEIDNQNETTFPEEDNYGCTNDSATEADIGNEPLTLSNNNEGSGSPEPSRHAIDFLLS